MVLKLLAGTKFFENGQKCQKSQNLIPAKFNTFKVYKNISKTKRFIRFIEYFQNAIK